MKGLRARLAMAHDQGGFFDRNVKTVNEWLLRSAEQGYLEAKYEFARRCILTKVKGHDSSEGIRWYREAAQENHARAQYGLAVCLVNGKGTQRNLPEAFYWLTRAALNGSPKAQHRIGILEEYMSEEELREARKMLLRDGIRE